MNALIAHLPAAVAAGLSAIGVVQTLAGVACVRRFARQPVIEADLLAPVTVLKPLHGPEPLLEEALASFFRQDYPSFQLVFGVQSADDEAIAVVDRLRARYPMVDAVLVVDATPHGANRKVANLINMFPQAAHDLLVISDSDMHAPADYLRKVAAAFVTPGTGLVTSLYVGKPAGGRVTAQLGAAYINQIFATGAVMARVLGRRDCLGATMALSRATLRRIGGLEALSPYVADDGVLGRLVLATGQGVALAATVPATTVEESGFGALFSHELRWARTIRAMAPYGFVSSCVQFPIFWALLALAVAPDHIWPVSLVALSLVMRAASGRAVERALGAAVTPLWMVPLRDVLSIVVMACAYGGEKVAWRGQVMSTAPDRALAHHELAQHELAQKDEIFAAPPVLAHGEG